MKIATPEAWAFVNPRTASRFLAAMLGLAAVAILLAACQGGGSRRTDHSYWSQWYGDPDTARPCCGQNN